MKCEQNELVVGTLVQKWIGLFPDAPGSADASTSSRAKAGNNPFERPEQFFIGIVPAFPALLELFRDGTWSECERKMRADNPHIWQKRERKRKKERLCIAHFSFSHIM